MDKGIVRPAVTTDTVELQCSTAREGGTYIYAYDEGAASSRVCEGWRVGATTRESQDVPARGG